MVPNPSTFDEGTAANAYVEFIREPKLDELRALFTDEERETTQFLTLRGEEAAGKTTLYRKLLAAFPDLFHPVPMVMCRTFRGQIGTLRAEEQGRDHWYFDEHWFDYLLEKDRFLFSFCLKSPVRDEAGQIVEWRATKAGLLKSTVRHAIYHQKCGLSILAPSVDFFLRGIFPRTQYVLMVPDPESYKAYTSLRGIDPVQQSSAHRLSAIYDPAWWIPDTKVLINALWALDLNARFAARLVTHDVHLDTDSADDFAAHQRAAEEEEEETWVSS